MAVENRVFLAVYAFLQNSGMVLAAGWVLRLPPAKQLLDSKCFAFGIAFPGAVAIPVLTIGDVAKRAF